MSAKRFVKRSGRALVQKSPGTAPRWAHRAAAVQGSKLAITVRAASHELGLSAAGFLLAGSPCERRRNHHTNFCGEPRDLVCAGAVGVTCQLQEDERCKEGPSRRLSAELWLSRGWRITAGPPPADSRCITDSTDSPSSERGNETTSLQQYHLRRPTVERRHTT